MRRMLLLVAISTVMTAATSVSMLVAGAQEEESLPDLSVEKTGPATAVVGEEVRYETTVTNIGTGDAVFGTETPPQNDANAPCSGAANEQYQGPTRPMCLEPTLEGDVLLKDTTTFSPYATQAGSSFGGEGCSGNQPFGAHGPTTVGERSVVFLHNTGSTDIVLSRGESCAIYVGFTLISPSRIENCVTADPHNAVRESDESNNTSCVATIVMPDNT